MRDKEKGRACGPADELALVSAVSSLTVFLAEQLDEAELALAMSILSQMRDTLNTILVQRAFFEKRSRMARQIARTTELLEEDEDV